MTLTQWRMDSKIGTMYLVASSEALQGVYWKPRALPVSPAGSEAEMPHPILRESVRQLEEYLEGRRRDFELPLEVQGTEFQKRVWEQLSKIPYGETCSYRDIAQRLRNPLAVRAVGTANGRNPFSIIVPCHRVITADGSLGGYAGGLEVKTRLLDLERKFFRD